MYLTDFAGSIPAREYEETVTAFIEDCLARTGSSDAGDIWELVQEERQDAEMSLYRQLEAVLGYNMGNGPEDVIDQLVRQSGDLGRSAVREAARLLLSGDVREEVDALQKSGTGTRISLDSDLLR
ncbi:MAG: hypothetical protein Q4F72_05550, partial [Desulfovibrionaceae bacterium]|nr:hypothetical protein [Desulfovibrionaceae bacterium]